MSQEINLYQPLFRREKVVFSASTMLGLVLGFGALFVAWALLTGQRVERLDDALAQRLAAEQRLSQRMSELQAELDARVPSGELELAVEQAEDRLERLARSRRTLRERVPDQPLSLVEPLAALGRHHPEGLWLTAIVLADHGRSLALDGRALEAGRIPVFLDGLREAAALDGLSFRALAIEAADDGDGVRFRVETDPEARP
ncbi:MAG: hypothetical protein R3323_01765 [Wenzhouxiangellaceae bacterium]|nr:hypothetical protein [Wenzhouxiangellaceae bacterium]